MMNPERRARGARAAVRTLTCALVAGLFGLDAGAQDLPSKPVRVIVPFVAGSSIDARMRMMASVIGERIGQQIIVDNRPGAGGSMGTALVAQSPPDGTTWLFTNNSYAINPYVYKDAGQDGAKALVPLNRGYLTALVIVVNPALNVRTLKELAALGKPGGRGINFGSSGIGSLPHFAAELFFHLAGITPLHVPFKGDTQVITEIIGGRIDVAFSGIASAQGHIAAGKLRALAVTSPQRQETLPTVPSMPEAGFPGYNDPIWTGFFLPAGTPAKMVERLNREISAALANPGLRQRMAVTGAEAAPMPAAQFASFVRGELERYAVLVKRVGLQPE